ncbi:MAG: major facilitator transporter [Rhodospirillaceae bacterium BRH_c57]|nr:MAG: major facilitator transporter [Rhodospirillaceae bacterium BRH_c57]
MSVPPDARSLNRPDPRSLPVAVLLTALVAFGPISTDMYLPSLPDMTRAFDTTVSHVQLTLSVFIAGFACGMLVYGPLSDRFGRRPVLLGGVALYMLASVACLFAPTIEALIVSRFVQAIGACAGPVLARAVVRDVYTREEGARMLSYMASAMALAPAVGPILGGWLHATLGWRSNFGALTLFGVAVLAATWWMLRETNTRRDPLALKPSRMLRNYASLFASRVFMGYTLTVGFAFGGLFSFISGSSFVVIDVLGVAPSNFGYVFAAVVVGYMSGAFSSAKLTMKLGIERVLLIGTALATAAGGIVAALALSGIQEVAAIVAPMIVYFFACALIIPNGTAGAIGPFPSKAGTVSALLGFLQMSLGATAGGLVGLFHNGTTVPMTVTIALMGAASLAAYAFIVRGAVEVPEEAS